ncbi:MAG: hypothetical protein EU530_08080 [Promethearchaeota archaeon]|nr:MAG: hypothetical protein EU530_08080 [Candidatus Lokiarchaeota archaeon]
MNKSKIVMYGGLTSLLGLVIVTQTVFTLKYIHSAYQLFVIHESVTSYCGADLQIVVFFMTILGIIFSSMLSYFKKVKITSVFLGIEIVILISSNIALTLMDPVQYKCNSPATVIGWFTMGGILFSIIGGLEQIVFGIIEWGKKKKNSSQPEILLR